MIHSSFVFLRRYSDTLQKSANLLFDVLFLTAKSSAKVSAQLGKISFIALNSLGVLASVYTVDQTRKYAEDAKIAWRSKHPTLFTLALSNVIQGFADLSMLGVGTAAALEGLLNQEDKQALLYQRTKYVSLALVITGFICNLVNFLVIRQTDQALQKLEDEQQIELIRELTHHQMSLEANQLRFTMDKDTLQKTLQTIRQTESDDLPAWQKIFEIARQNCHTQRTITFNSRIALMGVGLLLISAGKKWFSPNSLYAAIVNLSISGGWAVQSLREKWNEYQQRAQLDTQKKVEEIEMIEFAAIEVQMEDQKESEIHANAET